MSAPSGISEPEELDRSSKNNSWYSASLDISSRARTLLEEYSHIPPEDVDSHVYKMRDILWAQGPYPCIGGFKFLACHLSAHPSYKQVLQVLKTPSATPTDFLDLGCCVAQELRSLAHAGVPSKQLYGSDLNPGFLSTSYELFNDKDSFQGTLAPGDIFSEEENFKTAWRGWEGRFGVIHAGLFLHLFNREEQLQVCPTIIKLLAQRKGALFVGEMVGCRGGGLRGSQRQSDSGKVETLQYLHDEASFRVLWDEVAEMTGTVGQWKIEGILKSRERKAGAYFVGEGIGWFCFSVERI